MMRLVYVMDPMCSWCYAFQPELDMLLSLYPTAEVEWVMGGLAPDNDQPMEEHLKQTISSYWYQIEENTGVTFNHDFWRLNTPYRSTYGACRAVIAAESLRENSSQQMAKSIQSAYYQDAKNPSLAQTLIGCASAIGLDRDKFTATFMSEETEQGLQQHLQLAQQLQVRGFPALFFVTSRNGAYPLAHGYTKAKELDMQLAHRLKALG